MLCPLKFVNIGNDPQSYFEGLNSGKKQLEAICEKEKCAWWVEKDDIYLEGEEPNKCCAIKLIAEK
jgi:hypothetical protein